MDDAAQNELSYGQRQEVDIRLNAEDRLRQQLAGNRRVPGAFAEDMDDDDGENFDAMRRERQRQLREEGMGGAGNADDGDDDGHLDFDNNMVALQVWLQKPKVIKYVMREFGQFL